MKQNQNDKASNVAMGNIFRCHINSCYCFMVQDGVRDDCRIRYSRHFYNYIREQSGIFHINLGANCIMSITLCLS